MHQYFLDWYQIKDTKYMPPTSFPTILDSHCVSYFNTLLHLPPSYFKLNYKEAIKPICMKVEYH